MAASKAQPIIVIKKNGGHGGHHGGAWKVAYADFVTAMMALFIVLWLMSQSDQVKKEVEKLSKQIEITITPEGLRIELLEGKDGTFYESGSAKLSANGQELLALLAGELKTLPNDLLIEGHTDAAQYSTDANYSNWELSADRANSARRLMQQDGVRSNQVTQVRGYADQLLRVKDNPYDPSNRRISILVKNAASGAPPQIQDAKVVGSTGAAPPAASVSSPAASPNSKGGTNSASTPMQSGSQSANSVQAVAPQKPSPGTPANAPAAKSGFMSKLIGMLPGKKK